MVAAKVNEEINWRILKQALRRETPTSLCSMLNMGLHVGLIVRKIKSNKGSAVFVLR